MSESVIEVRDIKKSYGDNEILKGVSLSVSKGEVISIIGSSGSGKSTLLRCISQLEKIGSGDIEILGCSIGSKSREAHEAKKKVGMVFQQFNLFPHYSVLGNLIKPMMIVNRVGREEAKKRALEALETVKLREKADSFPNELSGGQKQRVAIARCLVMNPEIILFDEPTSALDVELAWEVFETIKQLAESGMTMLIVTHQINYIKNFSDRIVYINGGVICEEGTPDEIFNHPKNDSTRQFIRRVAEGI